MLGDEGVEVVFYRPPGPGGFLDMDRVQGNHVRVQGLMEEQEGLRIWKGGVGKKKEKKKIYYSAPPDSSHSHSP